MYSVVDHPKKYLPMNETDVSMKKLSMKKARISGCFMIKQRKNRVFFLTKLINGEFIKSMENLSNHGKSLIINSKEKFISLMIIFRQLNLLKLILKRFNIDIVDLEKFEDLYFN